jgi:hypothetical protein
MGDSEPFLTAAGVATPKPAALPTGGSAVQLGVLVFHADAIKHQTSVSAGVDLAVGLFLLAAGALLATGRMHGRRKIAVPAGGRAAAEAGEKDGWAQRVLSEPRLGLAMLVGAVVGIPGVSYLTALHDLVTGKSPTVIQVIAAQA